MNIWPLTLLKARREKAEHNLNEVKAMLEDAFKHENVFNFMSLNLLSKSFGLRLVHYLDYKGKDLSSEMFTILRQFSSSFSLYVSNHQPKDHKDARPETLLGKYLLLSETDTWSKNIYLHEVDSLTFRKVDPVFLLVPKFGLEPIAIEMFSEDQFRLITTAGSRAPALKERVSAK